MPAHFFRRRLEAPLPDGRDHFSQTFADICRGRVKWQRAGETRRCKLLILYSYFGYSKTIGGPLRVEVRVEECRGEKQAAYRSRCKHAQFFGGPLGVELCRGETGVPAWRSKWRRGAGEGIELWRSNRLKLLILYSYFCYPENPRMSLPVAPSSTRSFLARRWV